MFHEKIKALFSSAVHSVSSAISKFTVNPDSDMTRDRKLPAEKLIPNKRYSFQRAGSGI